MKCEFVKAHNLDRIHFELVRRVFQSGNTYIIKRGSWEGHKRLEFDHITLQVTNPETRPLSPQMPSGVSPVTSDDDIINYAAKYLMSGEVEENEIYTYGQYIEPQIEPIIKMLKEGGYETNQATMSVGDKNSVHEEHPACLRLIDCRVKDERLHFIAYFRSWDLWAGLPENLGGLQILKEYMCEKIGVGPGETIAMSKGLHLYDYQWPQALARLGGNMPEDSSIIKEEAELGEGWMEKSKI
jgi:thymidylate synthase